MAVSDPSILHVIWGLQLTLADKHYVPRLLQLQVSQNTSGVQSRLNSSLFRFSINISLDNLPLSKDEGTSNLLCKCYSINNGIAIDKVCSSSGAENFERPNSVT